MVPAFITTIQKYMIPEILTFAGCAFSTYSIGLAAELKNAQQQRSEGFNLGNHNFSAIPGANILNILTKFGNPIVLVGLAVIFYKWCGLLYTLPAILLEEDFCMLC